jgi:hypothetical protein
VDAVLGERRLGDGAKRVEPDVQRHALHVQLREQAGREVEPGGGRRRGAGLVRIDRLVALRVGERLRDVRRQRRLAVRLRVEQPDAPPPLAEVLEHLHGPVRLAGLQPARRTGQRLPLRV